MIQEGSVEHVFETGKSNRAKSDEITIGTSSLGDDDQTNDEKRLLKYLMRNYDRSIRPVKNASTPVVIRLGITLTQIFDLVSETSKIPFIPFLLHNANTI